MTLPIGTRVTSPLTSGFGVVQGLTQNGGGHEVRFRVGIKVVRDNDLESVPEPWLDHHQKLIERLHSSRPNEAVIYAPPGSGARIAVVKWLAEAKMSAVWLCMTHWRKRQILTTHSTDLMIRGSNTANIQVMHYIEYTSRHFSANVLIVDGLHPDTHLLFARLRSIHSHHSLLWLCPLRGHKIPDMPKTVIHDMGDTPSQTVPVFQRTAYRPRPYMCYGELFMNNRFNSHLTEVATSLLNGETNILMFIPPNSQSYLRCSVKMAEGKRRDDCIRERLISCKEEDVGTLDISHINILIIARPTNRPEVRLQMLSHVARCAKDVRVIDIYPPKEEETGEVERIADLASRMGISTNWKAYSNAMSLGYRFGGFVVYGSTRWKKPRVIAVDRQQQMALQKFILSSRADRQDKTYFLCCPNREFRLKQWQQITSAVRMSLNGLRTFSNGMITAEWGWLDEYPSRDVTADIRSTQSPSISRNWIRNILTPEDRSIYSRICTLGSQGGYKMTVNRNGDMTFDRLEKHFLERAVSCQADRYVPVRVTR